MFEFLASLICMTQLNSLSKLNDAKFATFNITDAQLDTLLKDAVNYYALLLRCKVELIMADGSVLIVKPASLNKCFGLSAITNKPRLLFYHNPNNLTDQVKSVRFTQM